MPQQNYLDELTPGFTPLLAIKEASRCLLCHDAPCSQDCPAQTDPGKFIRSIYFRNFKGAAETIRENNALGAVCARVCPTEKLCQRGCTRSGIDKPIDIARLQRFITDFEQQTAMQIYQPGSKTRGKVAIIGAGPAGLQASVTLTHLGYDVTIYEKQPQPGGWLRHGIPAFRLPQSVLDQEIARIVEMGVNIKCNCDVGGSLSLAQLKAEYRAVLMTVGMSCGSDLPLFEQASHVEIAVDFLQRARQADGDISVPRSALIIGGGDVAMDVASTLKILGCPSVTCVAREELAQFPASENVFTKAGLIPQHPDKRYRNQGVKGDVGEPETAHRHKALRKGGKAAVKAGNGRSADKVIVKGVDSINDNHRAKRGNKRRHIQVSNDDAVHQANHRANRADNQDDQSNRHGRHFRKHFVGVFH